MDETTEIMLLEMDFEANVPCELIDRDTREPCGQPAAIRIYSLCMHCGDESRFFSCEEHLGCMEGKGTNCGHCHQPRGITAYI
jgi:hypothetical protein